MSNTQKQATLVLVRGLPGSGKSTIVNATVRLLPEKSFIVLDPDQTDYESDLYKSFCEQQKSEGVDKKLWPYRYLRSQSARAIKQGKIIFWNQAFTNLEAFRKIIDRHYEIAENADVRLHVLVVEVSVNPDVARQRIAERASSGGHNVIDERFNTFVSDYRSFENEDFRVFTINGEENVESNATLLWDTILKN